MYGSLIVEFTKYRMIKFGILMMNNSFKRLFRFVKMVVRFSLKPKNDDISFWIEFIFISFNFEIDAILVYVWFGRYYNF